MLWRVPVCLAKLHAYIALRACGQRSGQSLVWAKSSRSSAIAMSCLIVSVPIACFFSCNVFFLPRVVPTFGLPKEGCVVFRSCHRPLPVPVDVYMRGLRPALSVMFMVAVAIPTRMGVKGDATGSTRSAATVVPHHWFCEVSGFVPAAWL